MQTVRIIPRLDIKGPNLVKGIHLEGLRVLGKPEDFAQYYYENGADELFFQDVVASLYERNSLADIISKTARNVFIPLTVGGGLRTIGDISTVLRAGADKVAINTAAVKNPEFIKEASLQFGSSTIVVTIEAIKQSNGVYLAFTDNGREHSGMEVVEWARKIQDLGAGEIVITSIDQEGTGDGFDLELIRSLTEAVSIPVIAHGGMGKVECSKEAIDAGADALAISSVLHYSFINTQKSNHDFSQEGNVQFLSSGQSFSKVNQLTVSKIKQYLSANNIHCRWRK